jgi:DNA repair protein RecN (Recombination protein N)
MKEIEEAQLAADAEDAQLEVERRVLSNAEKLYKLAMNVHELLYESEGAASASLSGAQKDMEELVRYDAKLAEPLAQLAAARAAVEDVSTSMRDFATKVQALPERLAEIEDRLAELDRLKRKYGQTLGEVIRFGEEAARRLSEVENRDALLAELWLQKEQDAAAYRSAAGGLTAARTAAAGWLEKLAMTQIKDLAMYVRFKVVVTAEADAGGWSAHGWDRIEYLIATNAGEPMKPLDQIASGGEMSRVMLALKVTVEESFAAGAGRGRRPRKSSPAALPTPRMLVFDEIDIGIGGRAAEAVGRKLKALSKRQQVVCITHLPQIASFADQHFLIEKAEKDGRTHTSVRGIEGAERETEIARMLSGAKLTETSMEHARQMLELSR